VKTGFREKKPKVCLTNQKKGKLRGRYLNETAVAAPAAATANDKPGQEGEDDSLLQDVAILTKRP
jgi:hypothetical protein